MKLLDDFRQPDGLSTLGTRWQSFSDQVMGGVSSVQWERIQTDNGPGLRMRGQVRLENNGGFIQMRLPLDVDGQALDARSYKGIRVTARGQPGAYYLHLKTPDCHRPWQYYRAQLTVTENWQEITVDFSSFRGKSIEGQPDLARLVSLGLVAYGKAFDAKLDVVELALV